VQLHRDQSLNELFEALGRRGIEVGSMRNKQNRLEQLFLEMVERGRDGSAVAAA
jgi:ABC-2 type transport system ATP-binding protein